MPRNHVLMSKFCLWMRRRAGIVRAPSEGTLLHPDCDLLHGSCCAVDMPLETHTLHVRLMTFLLPACGLMPTLRANPQSRKPMQPSSCAHHSLSPVAAS